MMCRLSLGTAIALSLFGSVFAFSSHSHVLKPLARPSQSPTQIWSAASEEEQKYIMELEESYAEQGRRLRRDFYDYNSWVMHRADDRFLTNLVSIVDSSIVGKLWAEVKIVAIIATVAVIYNNLFGCGFNLLWFHIGPIPNPPMPLLTLPLEPFKLASPSLGLLLVFRTNTSYRRWDEGRKAWGVVVNNSRSILRQTSAWILRAEIPYDEKQRLIKRVGDAVWSFPRSLTTHLLSDNEDEADFIRDVRSRLPEPFASDLIKSKRHRPSRALFEMSSAINELPVEMLRKVAIDEEVSELCNAMGGCDRIFSTPKTRFYTRLSTRFLTFFLAFLPFCLWDSLSSWNHFPVIFFSTMIGFGLVGIEELAIQLEEPFSILPMKEISGGIGKSADEHLDWELRSRLQRTSTVEVLDPYDWNPEWDLPVPVPRSAAKYYPPPSAGDPFSETYMQAPAATSSAPESQAQSSDLNPPEDNIAQTAEPVQPQENIAYFQPPEDLAYYQRKKEEMLKSLKERILDLSQSQIANNPPPSPPDPPKPPKKNYAPWTHKK